MSNGQKQSIIADIDLLLESYHDMEARGEADPDRLIESIRSKIQEVKT